MVLHDEKRKFDSFTRENHQMLLDSSSSLFLRPPHEDDIDTKTSDIQRIIQASIPEEINVLRDGKRLKVGDLLLETETGFVYDQLRRVIRATECSAIDDICEGVHCSLSQAMPRKFHKSVRYQPHHTYRSEIASALASMGRALRQPNHTDTDTKEALSALVAMRGPFKLIVFKNSLQMTRRIAQIRAQWLRAGRPTPSGMASGGHAAEVWFDQSCYAQLRREGWGHDGVEGKKLEIFFIEVPEGSAVVFSTWLIHAGHEHCHGDLEVFNRLHFYFVWWYIKGDFTTVNNHRCFVDPFGLNFSAALHFIPGPA